MSFLFVPHRPSFVALPPIPLTLTLDLRGNFASNNGSDFFTWLDQSSFSHDYGSTSNEQEPTVVAGGLNGQTYVSFNGVDHFLAPSAAHGFAELFGGGTEWLVAMVVDVTRSSNALGPEAMFGFGDFNFIGDAPGGLQRKGVQIDGEIFHDDGNAIRGWQIVTFSRGRYGASDPSNVLLTFGSPPTYVEYTPASTPPTSIPPVSFQTPSIGTASISSPFAAFDLAAMKIWTGNPTDADIAAQASTWATLYGL